MQYIKRGYLELTDEQYSLLSWLATCEYNQLHDKTKQTPFYNGKIEGITSSCSFAGISDDLIYQVHIDHNFTGLLNYNRLTESIYF